MSSPLTPVRSGSPEPAVKVVVSFCLKSPPMMSWRTLQDDCALETAASVCLSNPSGQIHRTSFLASPAPLPDVGSAEVEHPVNADTPNMLSPAKLPVRRRRRDRFMRSLLGLNGNRH